MPFIDTIPPAAATGEVAAMYRRQEASWGYVPQYATVFSHRPEVLARWGRLLAEIRRPMDDRRFELVTFAAAVELRHTACALAHGRALRAFLPDDQIAAIAAGQEDAVPEAGDRALLRFARAVARDASAITADDIDALRRHGCSDAEIFDAAAAAAGRAFFTKLLDALGVLADTPFGSLPPGLRDALSLGRPIAPKAPARMPAATVEDMPAIGCVC
jgi:uncharacterized peroxidase-related enzyme